MFALVKNDTIKLFAPYTIWEDKDGIQHSPETLFNMSVEQKRQSGIYDVAYGNRPDDRFYIVVENEAVFDSQLKIVKIDYTSTGRDLEDSGEIKGLKTQWITEVNNTASKSLEQTDWYLIRKIERSIDIPSNITTYRQDIVTEQNRLITALNAVTTVEELISVVTTQNWPTGA